MRKLAPAGVCFLIKPSPSNVRERWLSRSQLIRQGRLAEALNDKERHWLLRQLAELDPPTSPPTKR